MEDNNVQKLPQQNDDDDDTKNFESQPFSFFLGFNNLSYSVQLRQKLTFASLLTRTTKPVTKTILDDISGEVRDGEMLALLGASGSGKSTLLDALANRIAKESLKGTVTLNGEAMDAQLSKSITAYVMQDDLLYPMLTVEETLMFAAEFRLTRTIGESKKKERVQALIDQLGLRNVAKTIIGDQGRRGVSGGERRRVSIGVDIIHNPILLFLDEPTSGLDSTSAFTVVKVLKRIAQSGSVVVMSIHQPSFRILDLLDQLIFLAHGEVVYRGSPTNLARYFSNFGRPIPTNANQIEFVLDLISELEDSTSGINGLVEFNKTWKSPESSTNSIDNVVRDVLPLKSALSLGISKGKVISSDITNFGNVLSFANPLWIETLVLLKRSVTNSRRSREIFFTRLISVLITSLFFGSLYWQIDDSIEGVRQRLGFFPFAVTLTFLTTCQSISIYLQERYIFIRETAYNTYRRSSYVLSRCLVDIPTLGIFTLAFSTVTFWTIGLAGGVAGFLFYFLVICGSFWLGNSLVVFISGLVRNTLVGFTVMLSFTGYCLLFCGFFITKDRLPDYWIWFHYISLMKYPYEALMRSEFERQTKCFARGVEIFDGTPFADASAAVKVRMLEDLSAASGMNVTSSTCVTTGLDILQIRDVNDLNKWQCLLVTLGWCFFYWILFYFSLLLGSKNKRK